MEMKDIAKQFKSAEILPLQGKYYGTHVRINFKGGEYADIELWFSDDYVPSVRELVIYGYTEEQYKNNELVDDESAWGGPARKITVKQAMDICDSHFESESCLALCEFIVNAINKAVT
jgi:hypothetical protein